MTITSLWGRIREAIDKLLKYDPNPPVVVENNGRTTIVCDSLPPEANAMALAMYSRSPRSFLLHYYEVLKRGWKKFMDRFYVGYGHKSIGDCGSTTICIERVSMLAAKAVQNHRMYSGQEASSRYLDMTTMKLLDPLNTKTGSEIQSRWMALYTQVLRELTQHFKNTYPMLATDNLSEYEKAIKAKAFDVARGFLPAGCTTYVGWHTNLRQAWDHLHVMTHHPLPEMRAVAEDAIWSLRKKYPSSFNFKLYPKQEEWLEKCGNFNYRELLNFVFSYVGEIRREWTFEPKILELLGTRPEKTELPEWFNRYGEITFRFPLDFGSFRDLQRHRSCTQLMPLLTIRNGFNEWYLDQLPEKLRSQVTDILWIQKELIEQIDDPLVRQYYIAMGYNVACELTAGLPSAVYIAELRSGQAVHPTLRAVAQQMGQVLKEMIPEMALHIDHSPDEWSTVRGKHDIVKK